MYISLITCMLVRLSVIERHAIFWDQIPCGTPDYVLRVLLVVQSRHNLHHALMSSSGYYTHVV